MTINKEIQQTNDGQHVWPLVMEYPVDRSKTNLSVTSCENQFNLSHRTWEDYRGGRFYKQDRALVINDDTEVRSRCE